MRTKKSRWTWIAILALVSALSFAQFDFGGGTQGGSSKPWESFKLDATKRITLDFKNANVDAVIAALTKASGVTIVKDPQLTGPITVTSAKPATLNEAFEILNAVVSLKGFDMRKEGSLLIIRKRDTRGQDNRGRSGNPFEGMDMGAIQSMFSGSQTNLKVYPLKYANASQVSRVVNEVFATVQDPMQQLMQMFGGGGTQMNRGGFQGRNTRGGFQSFGRGGSVVRASSDDYTNSVIVNAPSSEQRQVGSLIEELDKQSDLPMTPKVYRLEFAIAAEIAPAVQNVLTATAPTGRGGIGTANVPFEQRIQQAMRFGSPQASFGTVVTDARTNSIIVTATEENHALVGNVIKELDTEVKLESSTFVVSLANARADDVAGLLSQAFGTRNTGNNANRNNQFGRTGTTQSGNRNNQNNRQPGGQNTGGRNTGGGRSFEEEYDPDRELGLLLEDPNANTGELMTQVMIQQGGRFGTFGGQQQGTSAPQGRDDQGRIVNTRDLTGQITIIPDLNTNSLIVVTSPDNVDLVRSILEQLDKIPEQVMIETIIVEATLDSSSKLGVEWNLTDSPAFRDPGTTQTGGTGFGLSTATPALQGFRYTITGGKLTAFMNALQTDQKFRVLSTPRIFTSNNSEAVINISQRVPYVLSSREDINGNLTFTYAFQDVGIVLTVTPRITANGYVTMVIDQTANDLQGFTSFNAPIINQRQANTVVSVRDSETIILGGIIRNTVSSTVKKVPLLGDIPVLGNLFRSTDKQDVKTELLVFLTPRVVKGDEDARKLREEGQGKLSDESQKAVKGAIPPSKQTTTTGHGGATPPPGGGR